MREHTSSWLDPASLYLFKVGMEALEQCEMFSKFITKTPEIRRYGVLTLSWCFHSFTPYSGIDCPEKSHFHEYYNPVFFISF